MAIPMTVYSEFQFLDLALLHVLSHSRQGGTYVRYPQALRAVDIRASRGFDFLQCFAKLNYRSERLGIAKCALLYSPQGLPVLGP